MLKGAVNIPTEQEFDQLSQHDETIGSNLTTHHAQRNNNHAGFNRDPNVVPFDSNRVKLRTPTSGNDYINATQFAQSQEDPGYSEIVYGSFVPSNEIRFFASQDPTPNTLTQHYQMLRENVIDWVVRVTGEQGTNELKAEKINHFGHITRKLVKRRKISENLTRTEYEISDARSSNASSKHRLTYFELTNFPRNGHVTADETKGLLSSYIKLESSDNSLLPLKDIS